MIAKPISIFREVLFEALLIQAMGLPSGQGKGKDGISVNKKAVNTTISYSTDLALIVLPLAIRKGTAVPVDIHDEVDNLTE